MIDNNYLKLDIQFFGEKTEEATPKKKSDTRQKGQVAQSRELTGAITLFVGVYMVKIFGMNMIEGVVNSVNYFMDLLYKVELNPLSAYNIMLRMGIFCVKILLYVIAPIFICAFVVQRIQVGSIFTFETIKPKLDKLNFIEGFKRMFSTQSLMNLVKSLLKISIVGYVGFSYVRDNLSTLFKSIQLEKMQFLYMLAYFSINLAIRMAFVILLIGIFDYFYQRYSYNKNLKMSKHEVKEEFKQSEGDPQIKSEIKRRQREAATRRMMQELPKADVIITNPTHFAVALKYDEDEKDAPYVIAKGKDIVAQKIKEKAREYDITIVENKPLARQLYKNVEIGNMIPYDLYEAVAEILAYVYSLKKEKV